MELRKEYIKRLLPVLGIIIVLALIIFGHNILKSKAAEADENDRLAEEELDAAKDEAQREKELNDLKSELTDEIYSIVEKSIYESLSNIDVTAYLTDEDYIKMAENIENTLLESEAFLSYGKELTSEQKSAIEGLISDAINKYALTADAAISDAMKENLLALIDERLSEQLDDIEINPALSEDEKAKIASDIASEVRGNVLEYVVEHIQILYGDGDTPTCGCIEHVHTEDCYGPTLVCDIEEGDEHTHSDECYEDGLICGIPEHTHDETCYQGSQGSSPCVHVHVDYLLTDDDKREIIAGVIDEADFARLLSEVFYGEIEKQMPAIIQDAFFQEIYDIFNNQIEDIKKDIEDSVTVRYFDGFDESTQKNKSCLQIKVNGEWVDFISANSLAATGYLITYDSSGNPVFADGFTGLSYAGGSGSVSSTSVNMYADTGDSTSSTCYAETSTFRIDNNLAEHMAFKMAYSGSSRTYSTSGYFSTSISYSVAILDANDDSHVYASKTFFNGSGYCNFGYGPSGTQAFTIDLPESIVGKDIKLRFTCHQTCGPFSRASDGCPNGSAWSTMKITSITLVD